MQNITGFFLILSFLLSCTTKSTERKKPKWELEQDRDSYLFLSSCPSEVSCDEKFIHNIADYFCKENKFDSSLTFKTKAASQLKYPKEKIKIHSCIYSEDETTHRFRCHWNLIENVILENLYIYSEIVCQKGVQNQESSTKTFNYPHLPAHLLKNQ